MKDEALRNDGAKPLGRIVRFGPYELDLQSAELRKGKTRIRLQQQPFQILVALLERPGEIVLRAEIRRRLWPDDTTVEFDHSINAAVKRLRDALLESADQPRYIETIARRGYRFKCAVQRGGVEASVPPALVMLKNARPIHPSRTRVTVLAAIVISTLICGAYWKYRAEARIRLIRMTTIPEALRLINEGHNARAFQLIYQAQQSIPNDPSSDRLRREISHPITIRTDPPGAKIWAKAYEQPDAEWLQIGTSPVEKFLLPLGFFRWKVAKSGYKTIEGAGGFQGNTLDFTLDPEGALPSEMVHVPRGNFQLNNLQPVHLDDYWVDKYEVTNRQYKQFVDNGGYATARYWDQAFTKNGRQFSYLEAISQFRDTTGRPGPSIWELGEYPKGRDDFPVSGVSWYEAAAYCKFTGKQLPSIYHWYRAAGHGIYSDILFFSNFDNAGPEQVGRRRGLGPFGTYDMAGNVREWCWNATGDQNRYIAGGAWNDKRYKFADMNAIEPLDRSAVNGFRCIKAVAAEALLRPVEKPTRDYHLEKPVDDRAFAVIRSSYTYDHSALNVSSEIKADSAHSWSSEKISFDAAYDHQRVIAWLYLPKNVQPPYQTILYVPPRSAVFLSTIDEFELKFIDFLMRTGRAVLFPICQGMYDRRSNGPMGPSGARDRVIQQYKDLRRSLDYLDTRPDIAHDKLGFYGVSDGARLGLILLAQEPRIRSAVLAAGGLSPENKPVEIDEINFAPRVHVPTLMLNGRYDLFYPAETNQSLLFRALGIPPADKRYVLFDIGHVPFQQQEMKETLDWFDRYLGLVNR